MNATNDPAVYRNSVTHVEARRYWTLWELWDADRDEILTQSESLASAPREVQDYLSLTFGGESADYRVVVTRGRDTPEFIKEAHAASLAVAEADKIDDTQDYLDAMYEESWHDE